MTIIQSRWKPHCLRRLDRILTVPNSEELSFTRPQVGKWIISYSPANIQAMIHMIRSMGHQFKEGNGGRQNWEEKQKKGCCTPIYEASSTFPPEDEDHEDIVQNAKKKMERAAAHEIPCICKKRSNPLQQMRRTTHHQLRETTREQNEERPCAFEQ